jgi:hypothetical protein
MIQDLIRIAEESGMTITPVVDYAALDNQSSKTGLAEALFVMLPKAEENRFGAYGESTLTRVELVALGGVEYNSSDISEFHAVEAVAESLKGKLYRLITAIADTGRYDSLSRVSYKIIPWAYASQQVAVTATFDLVKPQSPC